MLLTTTILNGQSLSPAISPENISPADGIVGSVARAILLPSSWTAADLTFQGTLDGSTFADIYNNDGSEVTVAVGAIGADRIAILDPVVFSAFRGLKVRSGTSGAPITQGADRALSIFFGRI